MFAYVLIMHRLEKYSQINAKNIKGKNENGKMRNGKNQELIVKNLHFFLKGKLFQMGLFSIHYKS